MWLHLSHLVAHCGDAAVIVFFMLSGYVLALPFFRQARPGYSGFLAKRVCRIYIPFAVTIALTSVCCQLMDLATPREDASAWLNEQMVGGTDRSVVAGHFLMIGSAPYITMNSPMWTLVYELRVSMVFPLLMILCKNTRLALLAIAFVTVASIRSLVAAGQSAPWANDSFWITWLWMMRVIPYFGIGVLLSKHSEQIRALLQRLPYLARNALLALPIMALAIGHQGYLSIRREILFDVGMPVALVMALNLRWLAALLNRAVLQWLGHISYSVYLVHTPIIVLMFRVLEGHAPIWAIVGAVVIATLTAASISYRFVELPAMEWGRRLAARAF